MDMCDYTMETRPLQIFTWGEKVKIAVQWLRDLRQVQVRAPTCAIYPIFQVSGWVRHSSLLDGGTWGGHRSPSVTSGGIDKGRVLSHKSRLIEFFSNPSMSLLGGVGVRNNRFVLFKMPGKQKMTLKGV